jgi:tryptophanyl-tRNA synthetase
MAKEVVLTGLRSNAEFHIGNYLGAILPMVELQKKHAGRYQLNMFIPDLHSFTTPIDHGNLYKQSLQNLKVFVAAGLDISDPDTFIYRQSYIPAHSELTWILDCFSYFGELSRMAEFKDKSSRQEQVTAGLYNYPVLMAADILLYGAKWVPVGEDQRQHVEFTRDLAIRMNNKFGELFIVPEDNAKQAEFTGRDEPVRIRSLRNPEKKMSKSVEDPAGTIMLSDKADAAAEKIMGATTDSIGVINYDWQKQPGVTNLLQILNMLSNSDQEEVNAQWAGKSSYGDLKAAAADAVKQFLSGFGAKLAEVNEPKLMQKLEADETAMRQVAGTTLLKTQKALGLRPA